MLFGDVVATCALAVTIFGLATVLGMVAVGWVNHRDLTARGVDAVRVLVWMFVCWLVGTHLWFRTRSENPHPTLRA